MLSKVKSHLLSLFIISFFFATAAYATSFNVGVDSGNAKPVALVDEDGASISQSNPLSILVADTQIATSVLDGRIEVSSAGTPEQVTAISTPFKQCVFSADEGNIDIVVLGGENVDATLATRTGIQLTPLMNDTLESSDLSFYYVDAESSGDAITYTCNI